MSSSYHIGKMTLYKSAYSSVRQLSCHNGVDTCPLHSIHCFMLHLLKDRRQR